ncbi:putative mucin/carbohydrate-binding domain-containing protein [Listeria fleischmannii]|uniref:Enhancin n=1 Tax=Listeria fleischmannii TaxID=1069827 RepID=A0A841YF05_9LIST|nr:putative mucin/carbohydrate-binding domain-containing protein [Listeria fleischmannii]MBC1398856.1 enhancin [Listeria fleischmannii]MBC1427109.1 enhancin [Listeria fleischmannii]STY34097.1 Viral enhancin protein [Listeria fleischmannii subsp. coloradonensis]
MKKVVVGLVLFLFATVLWGHNAFANEQKSVNIQSIESADWIRKSGMSKGLYHDRQDLGFILQANTVLRVRQTNPNFKEPLVLRLLGNDSIVEKSVQVNRDWQTISSTANLVPFVTTPYGNANATLEYEVVSSTAQKPLPIYQYHENEQSFFDKWDKNDADYALVKGEDFQLFVPKRDKATLKKMADFKNLDELILHYKNLFKMYNEIAGFDNSTALNKNSSNRYFLKADAHGPGGAYYSSNWTAMTSLSVGSWLKDGDWGQLHEIGHGYQAGFDSKGMYTGEVFNNLYGVQYQYNLYGKNADKLGWLFDYGHKESVENGLYTSLIEKNGSYHSVGLREKLVFLSLLRQKAGNEALTKLYQGHRVLANQNGYNSDDYMLQDLFNQYYSEYSHLDFTPVLEKWGLQLEPKQGSINRIKGYPAVSSLAQVVPKDKLADARNLLDNKLLITSNFEMVTNKEIAPLNLKGNLTFKIHADKLNDLYGSTIRLHDGSNVVQEKAITGNTVQFSNIPNGVYSVEVVGGSSGDYTFDNKYVFVKEKENQSELTFSKLKAASFRNQEIRLLGLSDQIVAKLNIDGQSETAKVSILTNEPHFYFANQKYAEITIKDASNKTIYNQVIEGTNAPVETKGVPIKEGYQVEIYHREAGSRLKSTENIVDSSRNTNTWVMTKWGLVNQQLKNDAKSEFEKQLRDLGDMLLGETSLKEAPISLSDEKKSFLVGIQSLEEPSKSAFMQKYATLLPEKLKGQDFQFVFKGLGDHLVTQMNVSLSNGLVTIETPENKPHVYFNKPYASITIYNKYGVEKYNQDFVGTTNYPAKIGQVNIETGDYIRVYHEEGESRLAVQNRSNFMFLDKAKTLIFKVEKNSLKAVSSQDIPVPKAEVGDEFQYILKGLGDHIVTQMNISLSKGTATIETPENKPHVYFNKSYANIEIYNKYGVEKYKQDYVGTTNYLRSTKQVNLVKGDFIKVHHIEGESRLVIQNKNNNYFFEKTQTAVYRVGDNGLEKVSLGDIPAQKAEVGPNFLYF